MAVAKTAKKQSTATREYAVIETGGKQYVVAPGDTLKIEKLPGDLKEGDKITFDKVLLVDDGKDTTQVGDPYLTGAKVLGTLVEEGRGTKIRVVRYKAKSRYLKQRGHRQPYMKVKIEGVK